MLLVNNDAKCTCGSHNTKDVERLKEITRLIEQHEEEADPGYDEIPF